MGTAKANNVATFWLPLHSSHSLYSVWLLIFWKGEDANEVSIG